MKKNRLGTTELQVSAVSLGTWSVGGAGWGESNEAQSLQAIRAAVTHGITTIDTAPVYGFGNPQKPDFGYGYAETLVGKATAGLRDQVQLVTKCGLNYDRNLGPKSLYKRMTKAEIVKGCEESLRRLGTDYIDLLLVHWPDQQTPLSEVAEAMAQLMAQGKILQYGLSNFTMQDVERLHEMLPVAAVQLQYSMVCREMEAALQAAKRLGIGTMTYGTLGSGILTGTQRTLPTFAPGDIRTTFYDYYKEPKFSKIMKLIGAMDPIAAHHGVPVAQVAIQWSTQKEFVDTAILGASKPSHAISNSQALSWALSQAELAQLDQAVAELAEG